MADTLKFCKDLNEVKNITVNNNVDINDVVKGFLEAAKELGMTQAKEYGHGGISNE